MANRIHGAPQTFGERLRFAREQAGLSARALGQLAGLRSSSHVGMIERSTIATPHGEAILRLADVLGVDARWLVLGLGELPDRDTILAAVAHARGFRQAANG